MTVSLGDIVRITPRFEMYEEDVQNVYHVKVNAGGDVDDSVFDAGAVAWLETVYNNLNGDISDEMDRLDIVIQNITEGTPARFLQWTTYPTPTDTNTPLPLQCTGLISFPSDTVKSIGRKFIAGWTEADNDDPGIPTSGALSALADVAADIVLGWAAGGQTLIPGNWNDNTSHFAFWMFATVAGFWATQRRRRAGVGS